MPDDNDGERLVVLLEARISDFEKQLRKANGTLGTEYGKMRAASSATTKQLETDMDRAAARINDTLVATGSRMSAFSRNFAAGALAPVAGLLTLTGAIAGTKAALQKFGDIADKSTAAGVDAEFFQGIAHQAQLSGVEIDTVAGALATFAKNAGMAAEGKGRMVTALQALNPELLKNIQLASTQEQKIKLVADAIAGAKDQANAAAIASAAFGDAGVRMVDALSGGGAALDDMIAKAKEMGIIVDRDVIAHADEMGDKFDTIAEIIDNRLKTAIVNLGPALVTSLGWIADWTKDLAITLDQLQAVETRTFINPLQNHLVQVENQISELKDAIAKEEAQPAWMKVITGHGIDQMKQQLDALYADAQRYQERIDQLLGKKNTVNVDPSQVTDAQQKLDALAETARNLNNSNILIKVSADTSAAATAIAKITSLAPELRSPQQQAKDALNSALANSPDAIMRAAAVNAYNKTLAALDEADRRTAAKGASKALASKSKELADAYDRIVTSAKTRIGQAGIEAQALGLPQEAADKLRYTYELLSQAEAEGITLDPKKRKELTDLAAEMAHADAVTRKFTDAFDEQKKAIDSVADAFGALFSKPWTNWTDMLDNLLGSFASIGQSNLKDGITSLLNGSFGKAAKDNGGNPLAAGLGAVGGALPVNLKNPKDIATGIGGLFKDNPALGQAFGAAVGGLGVGYQTANPFMGGVGGPLIGSNGDDE